MAKTREMVEQMIKDHKVVIFSKSHCPYCKMAKEVFATLNEKYEAYELDQRDDGAAIQAALAEITGAKTVPRVFVKGECLGGGTDVKKLFEDGDLQKKL